ncbi:hypothetical protein [Ktedonobacter racemifer]|uniref:hypothetical protein n=1 Tax=Ktedonobacter racemifer TaxID=363277 RepID=UPI00058C3282|nr:hypothetical protein [Ktedonobacter racemifer]
MSPLPPREEKQPEKKRLWIKRTLIGIPLLCLVLGAVLGVYLSGKAGNASAATLVPINGTVPNLVKTSTLVGPQMRTSALPSLLACACAMLTR